MTLLKVAMQCGIHFRSSNVLIDTSVRHECRAPISGRSLSQLRAFVHDGSRHLGTSRKASGKEANEE